MTATCPTCKHDWEVPGPGLIYSSGFASNDKGSVGLTGIQATILQTLLNGPISRKRLMFAVYGDDPDGGPLCAENCMSVHLSKLRRKLQPLGFSVNTLSHGTRFETPYTLQATG